MQKTKVLCLILAMVLATAGTAGVLSSLNDETVAPIIPDNSVNAVLDKPAEGTPIDKSALENLFIAQGELQRKGGFVGTTYGFTTSAGIKQEVINNRVVSNGNVFKEMITIGIVKNAYQLFIYNGNYLYRKFDNIKSANNIKWENTASKYNETDFLQKFGHRSDALTGYILNDETVISGELEKEENGLFQYRYVLDNVTATGRMLLEMKTNSNMNGYSTFVKTEIVVVMDADWQVKTVTTDCKYKVPMFGGVDCVEDITETFSDLEEGQELPEMKFFEQFFDAEVVTPVEKDPDALSILMDMFAPHIGDGKSLDISVVAKNDGQVLMNGLVSAKIDIENIQNIEVSAKIGDDLYIEYQQGAVYVSYQDFKASTTVDGIMGVVNAFLPQAGIAAQTDDETDNDILSKFTYAIEDGVCTVSLPLEIGEEKLEINIYANVTEDGYQFTNANVTLGSLEISIELASKFEMPERSGEYPEILGLLDLVQNGVIYGSVNAFGMDIDVVFDVATTSLYASTAGLSVIYQNDTIYAEYGAIKAKLATSDVERLMTLLRFAGVVDVDSAIELPKISVEQVIALLGDIKATATDNGVKFSLSMDDLSAEIFLVATDNGWNVDKVTVAFGQNVITLAVTAPTISGIPEVKADEYADAMDLLVEFLNPIASIMSASGYCAKFDLAATIDNQTYNIVGDLIYDANKNVRVNATVYSDSAMLVKANVAVVNGIVYLDVNGLKTAFAVGETFGDIDLSQIVSKIYGLNDTVDSVIEAVYGIVKNATNLDLASIDLANLVKQFGYENGVLAITINADFIGLDNIDITLSTDNRNNLAVGLGNVKLGGVNIDANAAIGSSIEKIAAPNASDYVLNLKGNVKDIEFAVSADLLNMDVFASVNVFNQTILLRYVDDNIYVAVGEIAVVGKVSELGALVEYVASAIGIDGNEIDLGGVANVDLSLDTIINAISVNLDGALNIGFKVDDLASAEVNFDSEANFVAISAEIMGYQVNVERNDKQAEKLDLNRTYIPVEAIAKQIVEIYNNFKNITNTGIAASVNANVAIDGVEYTLGAVVNYNNGLYLNVTLADNANALIALDMYLVDNVLYAEVNGVRVATELPATEAAPNANVDLETVLNMLGQVKGYNAVLDSVIAVVESLPDKLSGIDYVGLLTALTYSDNVLSVSVNGETLGLSLFDITLTGSSNIELTINGLTIGNVTINGMAVNATPACEQVNAPSSEYVTELQVEVMGLTVTVKLDLLNKTATAKTTLIDHELGVYYADNVVYVSYGAVKAKMNIADINELIEIISSFIEGEMPSLEMPELEVKQIIDSLSKVTTDNGYDFKAAVAGVNVTLSFDANAKLTNAYVNVNDIDVKATLINGATYPVFDLNADYIDLVDLAEAFADSVQGVIKANGYDVTLNGNFAFDSNVYDVQANVIYNGGLYVNANVLYNASNMLNVELWLVDNTLYASVGDLKLAVAVPQSTSTQKSGSNKIDLNVYMGYNPYVDGVLKVVQSVIDKFASNDVDYVALIDTLALANGQLTLRVNGAQLGLEPFVVNLNADNGIYANVSNLAIDKMTASFSANVKASDTAIVAPQGDFTTSLSIRIDDKNTVYANLDLLNGVYNFRLDDMYVMYADNIVKINKGDIYVSGNINQIIEYVKQIDDLVNEFSGATSSTMAGINFDMFNNVDIKEIVNSLAIDASDGVTTVSASALGFDIQAMLAYGKLRKVIVPVSLIDKTLEIEPCKSQSFDKFDGEHDYIQIEQVFNDYFPAFERLVHTNSWKFNFDGDAWLSIGKDAYKVAAGSYFEFYYKNTEGMNTFKLRAKLDVHKQRADGSWQPYMDLDIVYKDGNIYVTDRGRLINDGKDENRSVIKLTVSIDTLIKCYDLYDEIVAVVPQIGELVDNMKNAMDEAENNAESISYSTILNNVSYVDGLFGLELNGAALLSKLGGVALSAQTYGEGLSLNGLQLCYDTISLQVTNLRVYASELEEKDGVTEYATVNDINAYKTEGHMDFNSLYELLSSFVITATPLEENNGARSFFIEGTAVIKLKFGFDLADINMGLSVKVDIDKDNNVHISAKITRSNDKIIGILSAYDDKGGNSYLYFDGVNKMFTVVRNSAQEFCTRSNSYDCSKWHSHNNEIRYDSDRYGKPSYLVENIPEQEFTANIMDYIFEMINLNSSKSILLGNNSLEGLVKDNIANSNSNDFGIEDILTNYTYVASEQGGDYKIELDLTPIDSNLTSAMLDIYHGNDYKLNKLTGDLSLLKGLCTVKLDMSLKDSVCGEARDIVQQVKYW